MTHPKVNSHTVIRFKQNADHPDHAEHLRNINAAVEEFANNDNIKPSFALWDASGEEVMPTFTQLYLGLSNLWSNVRVKMPTHKIRAAAVILPSHSPGASGALWWMQLWAVSNWFTT